MAQKINLNTANHGWTPEKLKGIFGTRNIFQIMANPYSEVKAKYDAYIKKNEIKVGDVVKFKGGKPIILVSYVGEYINGIALNDVKDYCKKGSVYSIHKNSIEKTGKHIDLSEIFNQLREGDSDSK